MSIGRVYQIEFKCQDGTCTSNKLWNVNLSSKDCIHTYVYIVCLVCILFFVKLHSRRTVRKSKEVKMDYVRPCSFFLFSFITHEMKSQVDCNLFIFCQSIHVLSLPFLTHLLIFLTSSLNISIWHCKIILWYFGCIKTL